MTKPTLALLGLLILTNACGDDDLPTTPTPQTPAPTPTPAPAPAPTPPPAAPTAVLTITPSTLQVAWRETPNGFPDCAGKPNFWQWDVTIRETAGVAVTLTRGVTIADGQVLSTGTLNVSIPARGSATRSPYQCWQLGSVGHAAQTTYSGTDANGREVSVTSPIITLTKRP